MRKKISIVIPVYNEQDNIGPLHKDLTAVLQELNHDFEIIFVDDGSRDQSLSVLKDLAGKHDNVYFIELSRNFGQQYALKAGMDVASGDCMISMDCDLQHPPEVIRSLIAKWEEGYDVVYTRRNYEEKLPWLKRKTAVMYYNMLNWLAEINLDYGVADFRLLDRKVVRIFNSVQETGLFLRGLVKWVGYRQIGIDYKARDRYKGESKYRLRNMLAFGLEGVLSFSTKPLLIITYTGISLFAFSILCLVAIGILQVIGRSLSDTVLILWGIMFFCSLQLFVIGIICLYMSKLVLESRRRPPYLVRDSNYKQTKSSEFQ